MPTAWLRRARSAATSRPRPGRAPRFRWLPRCACRRRTASSPRSPPRRYVDDRRVEQALPAERRSAGTSTTASTGTWQARRRHDRGEHRRRADQHCGAQALHEMIDSPTGTEVPRAPSTSSMNRPNTTRAVRRAATRSGQQRRRSAPPSSWCRSPTTERGEGTALLRAQQGHESDTVNMLTTSAKLANPMISTHQREAASATPDGAAPSRRRPARCPAGAGRGSAPPPGNCRPHPDGDPVVVVGHPEDRAARLW